MLKCLWPCNLSGVTNADACKSIQDQAKSALDQAKAYSEEAAAAAVCSCCGERSNGKTPVSVKDVNLVTQTALMRLQIPIFKCDRCVIPISQSCAHHIDAEILRKRKKGGAKEGEGVALRWVE